MIDPFAGGDGPLPATQAWDAGSVGWATRRATAADGKVAKETRSEPSTLTLPSKPNWLKESHIYYHRADDEAALVKLPGLEDTKELLSWSETRQDEHKKRLIQALMRGKALWDAQIEFGINDFTLQYWRDNDENLAAIIKAWENSRVLTIERRVDDIIFHPERYDKALSRPGYFQFTISRLKALDPRYKDNTQINVDNRSITIGNADASMLVGKARDQAQVIEGVKTALLARGRKPPTAS